MQLGLLMKWATCAEQGASPLHSTGDLLAETLSQLSALISHSLGSDESLILCQSASTHATVVWHGPCACCCYSRLKCVDSLLEAGNLVSAKPKKVCKVQESVQKLWFVQLAASSQLNCVAERDITIASKLLAGLPCRVCFRAYVRPPAMRTVPCAWWPITLNALLPPASSVQLVNTAMGTRDYEVQLACDSEG